VAAQAKAALVPADPAAAVDREEAQAAGVTVAAGTATVKGMDLRRVAQASVATQGHGTLSAATVRDRGLILMPEAFG
jgi:hypothetical protein